LDSILPARQEPDADQLAAIVDLCAWIHAEWVRIHPFANGNGRTARLWANCLALRYDLQPFIRLRPWLNSGYAAAGTKRCKETRSQPPPSLGDCSMIFWQSLSTHRR
jgi:hypothetical protein